MSPARRSAPPRPKRVDVRPPGETRLGASGDESPDDSLPRASRGDPVPLLGNDELARIFYEIGDMLEIRGEIAFKVGAYRRAADWRGNSPIDIAPAYRSGKGPQLTGVGKAIDEKLAELADTGRLRFYERLRRDVPPSVVTLLAVPGLGPRTAGDLWRQAGIASLDELERAASSGQLRNIRGISEKTEAKLLDGLQQLRKRPARRIRLDAAADISDRVARALSSTAGVRQVIAAGSFRRRRETVADLDVLVETDNPAEVLDRLHRAAWVERVGGHGGRPGGTTRTTV